MGSLLRCLAVISASYLLSDSISASFGVLCGISIRPGLISSCHVAFHLPFPQITPTPHGQVSFLCLSLFVHWSMIFLPWAIPCKSIELIASVQTHVADTSGSLSGIVSMLHGILHRPSSWMKRSALDNPSLWFWEIFLQKARYQCSPVWFLCFYQGFIPFSCLVTKREWEQTCPDLIWANISKAYSSTCS